MVRFKIGYHLDKDLKPEEVNIAKSKEVKIIDIKEELPDLIIKDESVAREWLNYLNTSPDKEYEINNHIASIKSYFEKYADINTELIKPKETKYVVDDDEEYEYYEMELTDKLFYEGYKAELNRTRNNINGHLTALKNILMEL